MLGLAYWGYKKYFPAKLDQTFVSTEYTVSTWDVSNTINLAGTTQFANAQKLTFVQKWRVTSVNVKVGDMVKKDQILATITTDELDKNVEKAKNLLKNAQRNLQKKLESSDRGLDLLQAQSNYEVLILKQKSLPDEQVLALKKAEKELRDVQRAYDHANNDFHLLMSGSLVNKLEIFDLSPNTRERNTKIENLIKGLRSQAFKLDGELQSYDKELKVTDTYLDYGWDTPSGNEIYIGAKDQRLLARSKEYFRIVKKYVNQLKSNYDFLVSFPLEQITQDQILSWYSLFKSLGEDMKKRWKINYELMFDSIEHKWLTRNDIERLAKTLGSSFEDAGDAYAKLYIDAADTLALLKNTEKSLDAIWVNLENATLELQKKKIELEILKKQQLVNVAKMAQEVLEAKEKVESLKLNYQAPEEIELLKDAVDEAQLNLTTLMKQYEDYRIIANFDGVVTKLNMQVGDSIWINSSVSDTDAKYIYVETPDLLEVKLEVDQIDIVKINLGMPVQVFVDALPDVQFSWSFAEIDTLSDGNSYKAKVVFKKENADQKILGGMSATIKVILDQELGALIVPNPAIAENENGEKIVRLQKNGNWIDKLVEVGISDDANTVILSGLNIGDIIKGLYINDASLQNLGVGPQDDVEMY